MMVTSSCRVAAIVLFLCMATVRAGIAQDSEDADDFQVYSRVSEHRYPLSEQRLVVIAADQVTVQGWDGAELRCVLEKRIIAKQPPGDADFQAIKLTHDTMIAEQMVGLTRQQRDQQEAEFLQSANGRDLTEQQRAERRTIVERIHHSYDAFAAFQGREANVVQLAGLSFQEGNQGLPMRTELPGGGRRLFSQWQRSATLTVYVPKCQALAVRGALVGLTVRSVECDLVLSAQGARDRNYDGSFTVRGVKGDVTVDQVPLRSLSEVAGDVRFTATDEFVNSVTRHTSGMRVHEVDDALPTQIDKIAGDLRARFSRTNLLLGEITGNLDVINHYGATRLAFATAAPKQTQRIISDSGAITVEGPRRVFQQTPIYAYTQCGGLRTNLAQDVLDVAMFSTGHPQTGWHGLVTPSATPFDLRKFERPAAAIENRERAPGLDLISHAGTIAILAEDTE